MGHWSTDIEAILLGAAFLEQLGVRPHVEVPRPTQAGELICYSLLSTMRTPSALISDHKYDAAAAVKLHRRRGVPEGAPRGVALVPGGPSKPAVVRERDTVRLRVSCHSSAGVD